VHNTWLKLFDWKDGGDFEYRVVGVPSLVHRESKPDRADGRSSSEARYQTARTFTPLLQIRSMEPKPIADSSPMATPRDS